MNVPPSVMRISTSPSEFTAPSSISSRDSQPPARRSAITDLRLAAAGPISAFRRAPGIRPVTLAGPDTPAQGVPMAAITGPPREYYTQADVWADLDDDQLECRAFTHD